MGIFAKRQWQIILGVAIAANLMACTEKSYGPPENKPPIETQPPNPLDSVEEVSPAGIEGLQPAEAYDAIIGNGAEPSAKRAEELYQTVLRPIAAKILSPATLTDRALLSSGVYYKYLRTMHEAIVQIAEMEPEHAGLRAVYQRYEEAILKPCGEPQSACTELKFAARDARYAFVTMYLTKSLKPSNENAWKYMSYSMDFGLFPNSPAYSNFALDTIAAYLKELGGQQREVIREKMIRVKSVTSQIILTIQGRNATVPAFLERIDIWGEDAEDDQTRSILRETLWPVLIDGYAIVRGRPTPSFQGFVERQLKDFDTKVMGPFRTNPKKKQAFELMNLKDLSSVDRTLLFVIDQAYQDKISVGDALSLLSTLNQSKDQLITAAEQYVQIRFAELVIRTQDELKKHLGDPEKYRTIVQFRQQLSKSAPLEIEWASLQKRVTMLKGLIESQAAQGVTLTGEENRRLDVVFNKLDRNIKWMSIYPNMLPVIYYISKANLADSIQILWFKIDLNSELIFKLLFEGRFGTWFNFTNANIDYSPFSSPEVIMAFRNALITGLFESYGISPAEFISESASRLMVPTAKLLELNSQEIYDQMLLEYNNGSKRSYFMRALKFCKGDRNIREEIDFKDLSRYLTPFSAEFDGGSIGTSQSLGDIHTLAVKSREFVQDPVFNVMDFYRTDDMYMLDMLEKMVAIYEDYMKVTGKTDPALAQVKEQLERVHAQLRKFYGIVYYITEQYHDCHDKQRNLMKQRILQVLQYERTYIARAFADVKKVQENPALLAEVNASYKKVWADVRNVENQDEIRKLGDDFQFVFNKGDFMLRMREYFLRGGTDLNGQPLPAISPNMNIMIPNDLIKVNVGYSDYKFFYKHQDFVNVTYSPGQSLEQFMTDYMSSAFWGDSGDYMELVVRTREGRRPFVEWQDLLARGNTYTKPRMLILSTLAKLGKFEVYDFAKKGCEVGMTYEALEENCKTTKEITAQYLFENQQKVMSFVELTPEYQELFKYTKSSLLFGRWSLRNSLFSEVGLRQIGLMDGFRYILGKEGLGGGVIMPGESVDDRGYRPPHDGYLYRAIEYYRQIEANGTPLIQPKEEISGRLKEMYQAYVDREWKPLQDLEDLVEREEAAGRGVYSLNLIMNYEPFKVPLLTQWSMPLRFLKLDLNQKTDFAYDRPEAQ